MVGTHRRVDRTQRRGGVEPGHDRRWGLGQWRGATGIRLHGGHCTRVHGAHRAGILPSGGGHLRASATTGRRPVADRRNPAGYRAPRRGDRDRPRHCGVRRAGGSAVTGDVAALSSLRGRQWATRDRRVAPTTASHLPCHRGGSDDPHQSGVWASIGPRNREGRSRHRRAPCRCPTATIHGCQGHHRDRCRSAHRRHGDAVPRHCTCPPRHRPRRLGWHPQFVRWDGTAGLPDLRDPLRAHHPRPRPAGQSLAVRRDCRVPGQP